MYYISKWATEEAAEEFAKAYAAALPKRYKELRSMMVETVSGASLNTFSSADGPIFIRQTGNMVIAVESFDEVTAKKLVELGLKQAQETKEGKK
jgi:hypothetical protein